MLVPMIYDGAGGTSEMVAKRADDYLSDGAPTVCGMDVKDYPDNFDESVQGVRDIINQKDYKNNFYGISIYSNHRYPDWPGE